METQSSSECHTKSWGGCRGSWSRSSKRCSCWRLTKSSKPAAPKPRRTAAGRSESCGLRARWGWVTKIKPLSKYRRCWSTSASCWAPQAHWAKPCNIIILMQARHGVYKDCLRFQFSSNYHTVRRFVCMWKDKQIWIHLRVCYADLGFDAMSFTTKPCNSVARLDWCLQIAGLTFHYAELTKGRWRSLGRLTKEWGCCRCRCCTAKIETCTAGCSCKQTLVLMLI